MKKSIILIACILAGCIHASRSGSSYDALSESYANDARELASQVASELDQRHAPAHTLVALNRVPGRFGEALENDLRGRGFAIATTNTGASLNVTYRLDVLDNPDGKLGYAQVSSSNGEHFSFTRPLGAPSTYTEPPNTRPVPEEHPIESHTLPDTTQAAASTPAAAVPEVPPAKNTPEEKTVSEPTPEVAITPQGVVPDEPVEPITVGKELYIPVKSKAKASVVAKRNHVPVDDFCRWNEVTPNTILTTGTMVFLVAPPKNTPSPVASSKPKPLEKPTPEQTSRKLSVPKGEPELLTDPTPSAPVASSKPDTLANTMPVAATQDFPVVETTVGEPSFLSAPQQQWEILRSQLLRGQLEGWTAVAGYNLIWNAQHDYEMRSSATFTGTFLDAVREFFAALQANGLALRVTIYEGNKVMEVSEH